MLIYARRGDEGDGTILRDVMIVDQSKQLITKIVTGEYIEIELSPSGRYLACIAADCPSRTKGQLFIYDFQTNQGSFVRAGRLYCSHLGLVRLK
jgi:hypothetical protein